MRYVGRVFNDEANTSITPSFTLFDAVLRYDHGPWRFFINANNIFERKYYSASSGGNYLPGHGTHRDRHAKTEFLVACRSHI